MTSKSSVRKKITVQRLQSFVFVQGKFPLGFQRPFFLVVQWGQTQSSPKTISSQEYWNVLGNMTQEIRSKTNIGQNKLTLVQSLTIHDNEFIPLSRSQSLTQSNDAVCPGGSLFLEHHASCHLRCSLSKSIICYTCQKFSESQQKRFRRKVKIFRIRNPKFF